MSRRDYWQDPDAPKPTSRKPSASVFVTDDNGAVLLIRRTDTGRWTIPTGGLKRARRSVSAPSASARKKPA